MGNMIRTVAARSISQFISKPARSATRSVVSQSVARHTRLQSSALNQNFRHPSCIALTTDRPVTLALQHYATTTAGPPYDRIDEKTEAKIAREELEARPDEVSTGSSVRHVTHEVGVEEQERDIDMLAGVKSDLRTVRETFALQDVPREALYFGMAGVLPYLATSLSTVFLAWDINHAYETGTGFLLSGKTAELVLHVVEPIQIGYGAVIISFLGAIHWGFEWAKYGGSKGYRRYALGVVAPVIAWPTMLMPIEYALIAQFAAFNYMYFRDARATVKGWCPYWYSTYRFVLTFVVGASIVVSLIGRGQISDKINRLPGPADRLKALRESQMESLEREEREMRAKMLAEEEEEEEE